MTVALEIPTDDRFVGLVRHLAAQAARRAELSEEQIDDVRVAVSEVVANAFAAQRRAGAADPVRVEIGIDHEIRVAVLDRGDGVDMAVLDLPGTEPDEPTLGLLITRALVDDLRIERRQGGGSEVCLIVTREPSA